MARPPHEHPTPNELEVLRVLWDRGPCTVREMMNMLNQRRRRAYTSIMSLMNVMAAKGLLRREPKGRAFIYKARVADLASRAFDGSAGAMVAHLLEQVDLSEDELDEIRQAIDAYRRKRGEK